MTDYRDYLATKAVTAPAAGFTVAQGALNANLFPFQRDITAWALERGRAALFEERGLGKTLQELAWAAEVCKHTGRDVLIFAPLVVGAQTAGEGEKFGVPVTIARDNADEKHLCPFSLDVCHRAIELWTNPGDVVFDPFGGVGTAVYEALRQGRRGLMCELKPSYAAQAAKYAERAIAEMRRPTLFDLAAD